jgi:hypothetical protein
LPEVYIQPEQPGEILIANIDEKGTLIPAFVARAGVLQGRTEKELAFVAGKQLTYMRPEHYLKVALPSNAELRVAFLSALLLVEPRARQMVTADQMPTVEQYITVLRSKMQNAWIEQLHEVVKRFLRQADRVDLVKWGNAVEATAHRVGFIVSGDLETAARAISQEPPQVGGPQAKDKMRELVLYSISEDYFTVRQHVGASIA